MTRSCSRLGAAVATVAVGAWLGCGGGGNAGNTGAGGAGGCNGGSGAGNCGPCPSWSPPDAPDGGYSPAPPDGGPLTNDKPGCADTTCSLGNVVAAAADDRSLGFSATDLLGVIAGSGIADLTWYDGTTTTLRIATRYDSLNVYVQAGPGGPGGSGGGSAGGSGATAGASVPCRQMIANGGVITLSTDDGQLMNEDFVASIEGIGEEGRSLLVHPTSNPTTVVARLHGRFAIPLRWQLDSIESDALFLYFNPQSVACNPNCALSAPAGDTTWSNTSSSCGYDGKIVALIATDVFSAACPRRATVATWTWR